MRAVCPHNSGRQPQRRRQGWYTAPIRSNRRDPRNWQQVAQIAVIERRINLVGNEITHISREGIRLHGFHDKEFTVGAPRKTSRRRGGV